MISNILLQIILVYDRQYINITYNRKYITINVKWLLLSKYLTHFIFTHFLYMLLDKGTDDKSYLTYSFDLCRIPAYSKMWFNCRDIFGILYQVSYLEFWEWLVGLWWLFSQKQDMKRCQKHCKRQRILDSKTKNTKWLQNLQYDILNLWSLFQTSSHPL